MDPRIIQIHDNLAALRRAASEVFTVQADNYLRILDGISRVETQLQELAAARTADTHQETEAGTCLVCNHRVPVTAPRGSDEPGLRILVPHVNRGRQCAGSFGTPAERFVQ